MKLALKILGICVLLLVLPIYKGWVLTILWRWFVHPFGVANLTIPWAIGLVITMSAIVPRSSNIKKEYTEGMEQAIASALLEPLIVLGIGYIVKGFM
jgi:hypothetical protein